MEPERVGKWVCWFVVTSEKFKDLRCYRNVVVSNRYNRGYRQMDSQFFYGGGCHWVCCLFKVTLQTAQWARKAIDRVWEDGRKMDDQADWSWDYVVRWGTRGSGVAKTVKRCKAGASPEDWSNMTRNVIIIRVKPPTGSMEWKSVSASIRWHWRDLAESFVLLWMKLCWLVMVWDVDLVDLDEWWDFGLFGLENWEFVGLIGQQGCHRIWRSLGHNWLIHG